MVDGDILGVNVRYYPKEGPFCGHDMNPPATVCVLVSGAIEDYAAYIGHGSKEWVALHGDKIAFEEACCYFPGRQLLREHYRD